MPILSNVKISPIDNNHIAHQVTIDGIRIPNVSSAVVEYEPNTVPTCTLTINSLAGIDDQMIADIVFSPESIHDCIKFLSLRLQLDDDLREAWKATIETALRNAKEHNLSIENTATAVINQIIK